MSYVVAKEGNSSVTISLLVHLHVQYWCKDCNIQQGSGIIINMLSDIQDWIQHWLFPKRYIH